MRWIALLLLAAFAACSGETTLEGAPLGWGPASSTLYQPPAGGGGIVGDWFFCEEAGCTALSGGGVRFAVDGTWSELWVLGQDASGLAYCVSPWTNTYGWDGTTLTLQGMEYDGDLTCHVTFAGDAATLDCGDLAPTYLVRASGQVEECPIYEAGPTGG